MLILRCEGALDLHGVVLRDFLDEHRDQPENMITWAAQSAPRTAEPFVTMSWRNSWPSTATVCVEVFTPRPDLVSSSPKAPPGVLGGNDCPSTKMRDFPPAKRGSPASQVCRNRRTPTVQKICDCPSESFDNGLRLTLVLEVTADATPPAAKSTAATATTIAGEGFRLRSLLIAITPPTACW